MSRDILIREFDDHDQRRRRTLFEQIQQINSGKTANAGTVTLTDSVATTTVNHPGFEATMGVWLFPTTANAATEFGAGTIYVSTKNDNSFVITHVNNAQTDRTFDYVVIG